MRFPFISVFSAFFIGSVFSRPTYVTRIPNGNNVPGVAALGHVNPSGGGPLNVFGNDFSSEGHQWTEDLCRKDSDNDGLSNGQELGDPECVWREGELPFRTTDLTHPGFANTLVTPEDNDTITEPTSPNVVASSCQGLKGGNEFAWVLIVGCLGWIIP